jgi:hypothetical protein
MLENSIGVPWIIGCCAVKSPCLAHNIARYHFRIRGDDIEEEVFKCCLLIGYDGLLLCYFIFIIS